MKYLGFDLWQVKSGTVFSHLLVSDSIEEAEKERREIAELTKKEKEEEEVAAKKKKKRQQRLELNKLKKEEEEKKSKEEEDKKKTESDIEHRAEELKKRIRTFR